MQKIMIHNRIWAIALGLFLQMNSFSETVGIFYDSKVEQIKFAAGDIKKALVSKNFTVDSLPLSALDQPYPNKKIVLAVDTNKAVAAALVKEGGTMPGNLGEQAYGLRTTANPAQSHWVLGGDDNGVMYGGLQIAENISFNNFSLSYTSANVESPKILKRGIKLNLAFDKESTTYGTPKGTSKINGIKNVWDITFWSSWFDEMARNRYNVITVWNNHPFTSMIKMTDYPDVAVNGVIGLNNEVINNWTIDQKIIFWKQVMAYAHARGFEFYLFNWNLWTNTATGKHGITESAEGVTNPSTIAYMRKCMSTLIETYPDLDGFGITAGEHMADSKPDNSAFLAKTYGLGMVDYLKDHPERKFNFIHRWWVTDFALIKANFAEVFKLKNITFDMSYKYCAGHCFSAPAPAVDQTDINALIANNMKTWFTVRNETFFYHNWGDPGFAREFINKMPGTGTWSKGFYLGSDSYSPTRTFFSKQSVYQNKLDVMRQWYLYKLWGRIAYNPNTPDEVFQNFMELKFKNEGLTSKTTLFDAWKKASKGVVLSNELVVNTGFRYDDEWTPEISGNKDVGYITLAAYAANTNTPGSLLCDFENSAKNTCEIGRASCRERVCVPV